SPVASGPLRRLSLWLCRSHPSRGHVRQSALRFGAAPALQGRGHRDGDDQLSASQLRARHGVQDERQAWGQRRHQPGHHRRRAGRGRHRRGGRVQDGQSELSSVCEGRLLSVTSSPPAPLRHHPFLGPGSGAAVRGRVLLRIPRWRRPVLQLPCRADTSPGAARVCFATRAGQFKPWHIRQLAKKVRVDVGAPGGGDSSRRIILHARFHGIWLCALPSSDTIRG
ncbi:unnamed protein product, partial [Prorocentrum cordatum]